MSNRQDLRRTLEAHVRGEVRPRGHIVAPELREAVAPVARAWLRLVIDSRHERLDGESHSLPAPALALPPLP